MAYPLYEDVSKRTEHAKHWRMSDGSWMATISLSPQHYQDGSGLWQNLDTSIADPIATPNPKQPINHTQNASGGWHDANNFTTPYAKGDMRLPRNIKGGYSIAFATDSLKFTPVNASPSLGQINPVAANEIDYQDVWVDTDVSLAITSRGVKETITLKSSNSPTKFSFKVDGNLTTGFTSGTLQIEAPWYQDANGTTKNATMTQRTQAGATYIDITIDTTGMAFPIIVDPTTSIVDTTTGAQEGYTESANGTTNMSSQSYYMAGDASGDNNWILLNFPLSSIPAGSTITSGSLGMTYHGWGGTSSSLTLAFYFITAAWNASTVTYNTNPTIDTASPVGTPVTYASSPTYANFTALTYDVTAYVARVMGGATNNGFVMTNSGTTSMALTYCSSHYGTPAYDPTLTVTYDQPPTAPSNVNPSGGQTINTTYNITWTAATDPDTPQASLTYQIDLSQNNGSTWTTIVPATAAGATSYTYDFTNTPASSTNLIRIRAYDGTAYGPYAQSAGVFTIQHNLAPTAPTNLAPTNNTPLDRTQPVTATWTYNDPDGDTQAKFDIEWSTDGGTTWTQSLGNVSAVSSYTWAANTFPHGYVDVKVMTYDSGGLNSPWSAQAQFLAGNVPAAPSITSPANNGTVATANPTLQWSSVGQTAYEIQVQTTGGASLWDSGTITSTNTAQTITGYNLANSTSYKLALRIMNSDGLWSAWSTVTVNVSFTPPAAVTVSPVADNTNARVTVTIANTAPSGSQPTLDHNDLYRRESGAGTWIRIATGLAGNAVYEDYAVASGQAYDYYAVAVGTNATQTTSATATTGGVTLQGLWVHDVSNAAGTLLQLPYQTQPKEVDWTPQASVMQFAGRNLPVVEFGEMDQFTIEAPQIVTINADGKWNALEYLIRVTQTTLCFRDGRGRVIFGNVLGYKETDLTFGQQIDITLTQTSYSIAV